MSYQATVPQAVLDHMPQSVAVYDRDGCIRYMNPANEKTFGVSFADVLGKRLWDLFPAAIGNHLHQAFQRVAAGGGPEFFDHYYEPFEKWFHHRVELVDGLVHVVAGDVTEDVRRRRCLDATTRISAIMTAEAVELEPALQAIADVLTDVLDAECSLFLLSADRAWVDLAASSSKDPDSLKLARAVARWPADSGHFGEAFYTRSCVLADLTRLQRLREAVQNAGSRDVIDQYNPVSVLVAPLLIHEEAIGALVASRRSHARPLTSDDIALIEKIAPVVGLHIAHARQRSESTSLRHRLETVADSNPALVSFVDAQERYRYVNASFERWFGRPRESFLGKNVQEVLGGAAYNALAPRLREALGGKASRFRAEVNYGFGDRHVDVSYQPIADRSGVIEGCAATELDVTAEARLAAHESASLQSARRATRRLQSLLDVTVKLASAESADQIARVVVDEGIEALDANLAALWVLSPSGDEAILQRQRGFEATKSDPFQTMSLDVASPVADCIKAARPMWIKSRADYALRYPAFEESHRPDPAPPLAFALLPLVIEGQAVGCITFTFHDEHHMSRDERTYFEVVASHCSEALRRARLYAQLRDVSETREAMIQASPAAIMLLDAEGIVHAWNPAAERIFGWTLADVLGQRLPAVALPQRDDFEESLGAIIAGKSIDRRVTRRSRRSGEAFDVEMYAAPVQLSDGRTLCLSMVFDVSQRARIEAGRRLVSRAGALLTRSLDAKQTLSDVVALVAAEFGGQCTVEVSAAHQAETISFGADNGKGTTMVGPIPLIVGSRPVGLMRITSPARNLDALDEAILLDLASHMATAIDNARLYAEARDARREAEAASGAKDQFLAMLGHELRNPLAPITTALHLMRLRSPELFEHERAVIERQIGHLTRLVDDLLDVSRITQGKVELRRAKIVLANVVAKAVETVSPLLEQREHRLTLDVPNHLIVLADPMRLGQVVTNLVTNAAKYTDKGGAISLHASQHDDKVMLVVKDNGSGIAPEMLPTVFDVFVQAPQNSARKGGGLGLGLAIVRSLVQLHEGTVTVTSEGLGRGAEFIVTLPAASLFLLEEPERTPTWTVPRGAAPKRVLLVDDNQDAVELLGELIASQGHHVQMAFDGPSALTIAERFDPEVAVLDIGLPVMDGYELAQKLRTLNMPGLRRLIALTGYGQASDRARSAAAGFDAHVAKPVSVEEILRLIEMGNEPPQRA